MAIELDLLHPVTDEELLRLSERNPGYQFERTADGRLVVSPTGSKSDWRSVEIAYQLRRWSEQVGLGVVFGSSAGFRLPDRSVLSPDASWVRRERWEALSPEEQEGFAPLCPDAVFEIRSASQTPQELREKMRAYLRNGARIGILIDPYARAVEVYRPAGEPERHEDPRAGSPGPRAAGVRPRAQAGL
jgi:Uma2 family endonuclease